MDHYQRKTFLINKNFQIRYCVYVCSWLFALSCVYPFIVKEVFDFFFRFITTHAPKISMTELKETQRQLLALLVSLQLVFVGVTFLISVFVSHRIAGPVFKLRQWLQAGQKGNLRTDLYFRKSDYFREVATDYNLMISGVLSLVDRNIGRLEELSKAADVGTRTEMNAIISDLKQIRENPIEPMDTEVSPQASVQN